MVKTFNPTQALRAWVARFPSQKQAAEALQVSQPYLSDLVNARRDVPDRMLERIGLRKVYVKADTKEAR